MEQDQLRSLVAASGAAYPGFTLGLLVEVRSRPEAPRPVQSGAVLRRFAVRVPLRVPCQTASLLKGAFSDCRLLSCPPASLWPARILRSVH